MRLRAAHAQGHLSIHTAQLARRMLSPLCGLNQRVSFMTRGSREPRFVITGGELTGVHLLLGQPHPGSYHIGGVGTRVEEAVIRTLGETVERYAQLVSALTHAHETLWCSHARMIERGERVIDGESMRLFADEDYGSPGFRFAAFDANAPMTWVKTASLIDERAVWIPAQLALVGYLPRLSEGEPWLLPAMTTGTAAHVTRELSLRNGLLELIQIDSAMGHWYTDRAAPEIQHDRRTTALQNLIARHFSHKDWEPHFYWLSNPDLPSFTVACVVRAAPGIIPAVAVGLGVDLQLSSAMYKALLEAVGVMQLAKVNLVNYAFGSPDGPTPTLQNADQMFDLDSNVAFYAKPGNAGILETKFTSSVIVAASDLPADQVLDVPEQLEVLVDGFRSSGKELVFLDLTCVDVRDLGLVVMRVWSPDTLSLSLPGQPPSRHRRFDAYDGFRNRIPHPYP